MSILIEQHPAAAPIPFTFPTFAREAGPEWRSPTKGSIVALDAADAFAALLHHRIMAESTRMEHAARGASAL